VLRETRDQNVADSTRVGLEDKDDESPMSRIIPMYWTSRESRFATGVCKRSSNSSTVRPAGAGLARWSLTFSLSQCARVAKNGNHLPSERVAFAKFGAPCYNLE
jgi:hypothetical protein